MCVCVRVCECLKRNQFQILRSLLWTFQAENWTSEGCGKSIEQKQNLTNDYRCRKRERQRERRKERKPVKWGYPLGYFCYLRCTCKSNLLGQDEIDVLAAAAAGATHFPQLNWYLEQTHTTLFPRCHLSLPSPSILTWTCSNGSWHNVRRGTKWERRLRAVSEPQSTFASMFLAWVRSRLNFR